MYPLTASDGCPLYGRVLSPYAVPFERALVTARASDGTPYLRRVSFGMPKLGQYRPILKAVFFLYPDQASAKAGVKAGGTGFIVGVPLKDFPDLMTTHAVTNYHVAVSNKDGPSCPTVRINSRVGEPAIFDFDPSEWVFAPGGPDVAISPPLGLDQHLHDYMVFDPRGWFLTPQEEKDDEIGPGEDVFMIGRFVDYDGIDTNEPAARFGHISMMDARIEQSTGYRGRSIVLDMHSRSGFSGSPVIVYRTLGSHFLEHKPNSLLMGAGHYIKMLGMHYAQFPEEWELRQKSPKDPIMQAAVKADSHYIQGLSGMTCVVPSADIGKILYSEEVTQMRDKVNDEVLRKRGRPSPGVQNESAAPRTNDANPNHQEDFTRLVGAAARKPPQEG